MEAALKKLDKLTQEEAQMATAQNLNVTHTVDKKVKGVADRIVASRVAGIDDQVTSVDYRVASVNDGVVIVDNRMKAVDNKVTEVIAGG